MDAATKRSDAASDSGSLLQLPHNVLGPLRWAFPSFDGGPDSLPGDGVAITPWVGPAVIIAMRL